MSVRTWEKGSSSELGKSYWLRSLALKTAGPGWWGVPDDRGSTFCFFSYFLFCRGTSIFSGYRGEEEVSEETGHGTLLKIELKLPPNKSLAPIKAGLTLDL